MVRAALAQRFLSVLRVDHIVVCRQGRPEEFPIDHLVVYHEDETPFVFGMKIRLAQQHHITAF